ncbi:DegT/DnrJ/EryC1/StrS family aminotransferase [Holdemania massiliensis]|uniref:DegT/DnrJ/EryC1/StrS family aminotransferase n=1 Tax=Holdemania massiliensis TaxID=1468449 RepID=UPI001F06EB4A|nr:DegT/DnrJ/EryC1/StrS family aminotransferase [Holdemania massiliensis]MCH1940243.1 DegT/DnrJ/EryC1/StrS family aminotransferase [Holdemania massiliensis]
MKVENNQLRLQYLMYKKEYLKKVEEVLDSGWYVLGNEVKCFENEFAKYNDAKYCVGVASGLDALILAFEALHLNPGDEVIAPANTYIASIMGFTRNGLIPKFVEPDEFYNIDPLKIEEAIGPRTKAICVVHLYGQIANMPKIMEIAQKYNLKVIEDCAQSHGASINNKKCGTWGDVGCFSFYPTKNLGGFGDGGAIITNNQDIQEEIRMLRNYGSRKTYYFEKVGHNSRLDELQAGMLRVKLKHLDELTTLRRNDALRYIKEIKNPSIILPKMQFGETGHVFHLFVVQVENRDNFMNYCANNEIGLNIHYPQPPHLSDAYKHLGYGTGDFPITESIANKVVSIPLYSGIPSEQLDYVIDTLNNYTD